MIFSHFRCSCRLVLSEILTSRVYSVRETENQNHMAPSLIVEKEIFAKLPGLRVFVAVVRDIDPTAVDFAGCSALLSECWAGARAATSAFPNVQSHPRIAAWRMAYKAIGADKKYTSSIENLARRAAKPESAPRTIGPVVDLYNACSLKFLAPFGAFDLDDTSAQALVLRLTRAGDTFTSLDATMAEAVPPGEAGYVCGTTVVTRHINYKQSHEGLISDATRNAVFMAELLGDVPEEELKAMRVFFTEKCRTLLKREPTIYMVDAANPHVSY